MTVKVENIDVRNAYILGQIFPIGAVVEESATGQ
jgi:hypothetical protein